MSEPTAGTSDGETHAGGARAVWAFRVLWVALAAIGSGELVDAMGADSAALRWTVIGGVTLIWALVLCATVVPRTESLTVIRSLSPLVAVCCGWVAAQHRSGAALAALVLAVAAALGALAPIVGDHFIDASSYGDERRFALRAPAGVLVGPVPVVWLVGAAGLVTGPLLLAARRWAEGALAVAFGCLAVPAAARSLHLLARRVVVFVPAGVTLVDPITLVDSVLFTARTIVSLGPALTDSTAEDLTGNAPGLAFEITVDAPVELTRRASRRTGDLVAAGSVLFTPSRPVAVLAEARRRGIDGYEEPGGGAEEPSGTPPTTMPPPTTASPS